MRHKNKNRNIKPIQQTIHTSIHELNGLDTVRSSSKVHLVWLQIGGQIRFLTDDHSEKVTGKTAKLIRYPHTNVLKIRQYSIMCVLATKMLCTNSSIVLRHIHQDFVNNSNRPNSRPPCHVELGPIESRKRVRTQIQRTERPWRNNETSNLSESKCTNSLWNCQ